MCTLPLLVLSSRPIGPSKRLLLGFNFWDPSTTSECNQSKTYHVPKSAFSRFVTVSSIYTPTSTGESDNIFITRSYDATSHFETVVEDVQNVWKRMIGKDLVLKKREVNVEA